MTNEEVKTFAQKLISPKAQEDGVFGIHQYGTAPDESCIRANKAGLQLFAAELLLASIKCEETLKDKEKNIITLDYDSEWLDADADIVLQYIEPLPEKGKRKVEPSSPKPGLRDELTKYGCIAVLVFIVVCTLIGFITIIKTI